MELDGVWMVYSVENVIPMPLYLGSSELECLRYGNECRKLGINTRVKFWKFGDEFGTE